MALIDLFLAARAVVFFMKASTWLIIVRLTLIAWSFITIITMMVTARIPSFFWS